MQEIGLDRWLPLLLGLVGTWLGLYNLFAARRERDLKVRQGFALTLLTLEPLIDKLLMVPLHGPQDLNSENVSKINESLLEVEALIDLNRKDLVSLIPGMAGSLLKVRETGRFLRNELARVEKEPAASLGAAVEYQLAALALAQFRGRADMFDIEVPGRVQPSLGNISGDNKVAVLDSRWRALFSATFEDGHKLK